MATQLITLGISVILAATFAAQAPAQESPYQLTRGFPADEATIEKARHATTLRRAIEAYKYFYPTVATEAVCRSSCPTERSRTRSGSSCRRIRSSSFP